MSQPEVEVLPAELTAFAPVPVPVVPSLVDAEPPIVSKTTAKSQKRPRTKETDATKKPAKKREKKTKESNTPREAVRRSHHILRTANLSITDVFQRTLSNTQEAAMGTPESSQGGFMCSAVPGATELSNSANMLTQSLLSKIHSAKERRVEHVVRHTSNSGTDPHVTLEIGDDSPEKPAAPGLINERSMMVAKHADSRASRTMPHPLDEELIGLRRDSGPASSVGIESTGADDESMESTDDDDDDEIEIEEDEETSKLRRKHEMMRMRSAMSSRSTSPLSPEVYPFPPPSFAMPLSPALASASQDVPPPPSFGTILSPNMDGGYKPAVNKKVPSDVELAANRMSYLHKKSASMFANASKDDIQQLKKTNSFDNSTSSTFVFH